jgi:hypothetical protein
MSVTEKIRRSATLTRRIECRFPNIFERSIIGVRNEDGEHFVRMCVKPCLHRLEVVNDEATVKQDLDVYQVRIRC